MHNPLFIDVQETTFLSHFCRKLTEQLHPFVVNNHLPFNKKGGRNSVLLRHCIKHFLSLGFTPHYHLNRNQCIPRTISFSIISSNTPLKAVRSFKFAYPLINADPTNTLELNAKSIANAWICLTKTLKDVKYRIGYYKDRILVESKPKSSHL